MAKKTDHTKIDSLRERGSLNRKADHVQDSLFEENEFFDPHDLLQVKYEMLRRVHQEGISVSNASSTFGFSRLSFYRIQEAYVQEGLAGLIAKKRGPKQAHKLSENVMTFVEQIMEKKKGIQSQELRKHIKSKFNILVHSRSIEKALSRRKKIS